ncbi:NrsF family protein [Marilutibacter chinensis]|uniref:DUF1109 domain-containing protein n=1 Tax=Marilutibacter chinensis TaxID=2912247 RepID=A0ABS9HTN2_9GAMM|nr:NrsF family protein [Lysobacter chinensis]MCF7221876.1 DUF1109 domain-containing protein [Lysobacter chinensis]
MTDTDRLIDHLASRGTRVRPLASPLRRTLLWLTLAALVLTAIVAVGGLHPGALQALRAPAPRLEWIASVLVGVLAAYATFQVSVPGRSPRWALLPLPALALWLGGMGWGCLQEVARLGPAALALHAGSAECAQAIALTSLPLSLVMLLLVRHAGVVRPAITATLATLSTAALASAGVGLIHAGETMLMVLLFHFGMVAVLSGLSLVFSRRLFAWIGYAPR